MNETCGRIPPTTRKLITTTNQIGQLKPKISWLMPKQRTNKKNTIITYLTKLT